MQGLPMQGLPPLPMQQTMMPAILTNTKHLLTKFQLSHMCLVIQAQKKEEKVKDVLYNR